MWQHRSPSQSGGEVQSHMTRGSVGAYLNREVRSEAIGHVAAPDPIPAGGAESGAAGHVAGAHHVTCLILKLVRGGTQSQDAASDIICDFVYENIVYKN
jgi:hypothetical protein